MMRLVFVLGVVAALAGVSAASEAGQGTSPATTAFTLPVLSKEAPSENLVPVPGLGASSVHPPRVGLGPSGRSESANGRACPTTARGPMVSDPTGPLVRGCFLTTEGRARPYLDATVRFPSIDKQLDVRLLVDTGADRTVLGAQDAARLGIDYAALPRGQDVGGLGGRVDTRVVDATVGFAHVVIPVAVTILETNPAHVIVPSLLGRDVLAHFVLFLDERRGRVLLFEPRVADTLVP